MLDLAAQMRTWYKHDVGEGGGLEEHLGRVKSVLLWMPCETDSYFTLPEVAAQAKMVPHTPSLPHPPPLAIARQRQITMVRVGRAGE